MALRVVTPPDGGLISVEDARAHVRVDDGADDTLLTGLVLAASSLVEAGAQRRFLTQTLEWVREGWCDRMELPVAGCSSDALAIAAVLYADVDGVQQTLDPGLYWDRPVGETRAVQRQRFAVWPYLGDAAERVVIQIQVTGELTDVPPLAVAACKLLVAHLYLNREAVTAGAAVELPLGVEACLSPLRWS